MAKKEEHGFRLSENSLSLGLGILVVVVIGALIFNYIGSRSPQKGEEIVSGEQTAKEQNQNAEISLPTKHKVTQGEDLWKISERYYKSGYNWVDIAQANNLANPDLLSVDMELTIPNATPIVLPVTGSVTETKNETATNPEAITGDTYTVVQGDNLWKVAVRAYGDGFKWVEIAKTNNLVNPDLINAGDVFKIPR